MEKDVKHGTTTLGIVFDGGVVLAADKRATMGNLVAHKNVEKIHKVTDTIAMTMAGAVGDNQMLVRFLSSELKKFEIDHDKKVDISVASTLLSHILYSRRFSFAPYWVQILIAGTKDGKGKLYSLGADGSNIQDDFISTGSGSPVAYGLLQNSYKKGMKRDEALKLAVNSLKAAMERDAFTGEGIDAVIITSKGIKKVGSDEIKKILKK
ncbi:MAG: proteasome subunit beta [Nanoarchaeota archaeon]|nr:proteasome subunit beta [Nanoarchaeota archaeon]